MNFDYVTDYWLEDSSEDELRSVERKMRIELDNTDYDSDEYLRISLKHVDIVNELAIRFSKNLPHREHGWYLPNDE